MKRKLRGASGLAQARGRRFERMRDKGKGVSRVQRTVLLVLIAALGVGSVQAEIYRWTDSNGKVHFSDRPARDAVVEKVEVKVNTYEGISFDNSTLEAPRTVLMYSASWCGVCVRAKQFFENNEIPYKDYDVETSRKGKADFRKLGGQGVPVILVGKRRMNGFSEHGFRRLYASQESP